jgi:lipid II:glycine glycyltransferase (peptidoglycan interpeptide bridge formation enzyme)
MQATLFQAQLGDQIISSNLVFFQGKNAYYYDGGSSPEGMSLGASHFLMHTIINKLHADGYRNLNLGIARAGNDGLIRFKEGFAAELRFVDRATYDRDRLGLRAVNLLRRLRKEAGRRLKPA